LRSKTSLGETIDIAVAYTTRVFEQNANMMKRLSHPSPWPAMTPAAFMKAKVQTLVDHANAVLGASGVHARLRLVNTRKFDIYEESFMDARDALARIFPGNDDPYGVKAFRESTGADLTSVWLDDTRLQGDPHGAANDLGPYSVVKAVKAFGSHLSFAHEVAHNFGAQHPAIQGDVNPSPKYARGFDGPNFYTILSNGTGCLEFCVQIPYFSSPSVLIDSDTRGWNPNGVPAGNVSTADNARRIREQSAKVAAFRALKCPGSAPAGCGSPGGPLNPAPDPDDPPIVVQ
jgi:hypothetical protein